MTDDQDTSPQSPTESATPKIPAPKNRSCPFCGQCFTSSSLGRHLDLYIKPHHPKPPDGIHDVEAIKRLRGSVTRRQVRPSSRKFHGSTPSSSRTPSISHHSPVEPGTTPFEEVTGQKVTTRFNVPNWQVTGVINNLPPRDGSVGATPARRVISRHEKLKADFRERERRPDDVDQGKAVELALKEILDAIKEARNRAVSRNLFDFDPFTMSFPCLCLHILPRPPTLFSLTPFPTNDSWSIEPPGQKQFDALNRLTRDHVATRQQTITSQSTTTPPSGSSPLPTPPPREDAKYKKLFSHFHDAFNHWKSLPEIKKQEKWQLEVLRSYTRADEKNKELERKMEQLRTELDQCKSASRSQPFTPIWTPSTFISSEIIQSWSAQELDSSNWEFNHLIDKWKTVLRENRKAASGLNAQRPLAPATSITVRTPTTTNGIKKTSVQVSNGLKSPNGSAPNSAQSTSVLPGASSAPSIAQSDHMDEDTGDQVDGEGDDEDADADADADADIDTEDVPMKNGEKTAMDASMNVKWPVDNQNQSSSQSQNIKPQQPPQLQPRPLPTQQFPHQHQLQHQQQQRQQQQQHQNQHHHQHHHQYQPLSPWDPNSHPHSHGHPNGIHTHPANTPIVHLHPHQNQFNHPGSRRASAHTLPSTPSTPFDNHNASSMVIDDESARFLDSMG